ncbi:hypothetical protein PVAP13_7KG126123 [Panicum virgatum]|nr:hypothetical protein PVAP13_7KG108678 [Panicum virgatum]KAG2571201.1 hypothetical protein PVAP13_7KG126123 [Panicum virgatum]
MVSRLAPLSRHYGWEIARLPRVLIVGALFRELDAVHRVAIPRLQADPTSSINTANIRSRADAIEDFALKAGGSIQEPAIAFAQHLHLVAHHFYAGEADAAWIATELGLLQQEFHVLAGTIMNFNVGPPGM